MGPRKGEASEQEERLLTERRVSRAKTFDALPCLGSSLEDVSLDLFRQTYLPLVVAREVLEENHRSVEQQLASLRLYAPAQQCPTNAGMLLLGKDPLQWLPGAYVQVLRFNGTSMGGDVVHESTLSGDLLSVLRRVEEVIKIQVSVAPRPTDGLRDNLIHDYPWIALRELVMNAVLHRSYEATGPVRIYWFADRVEIQSPGGLYGEVSPENFPQQNAYRNPVLAEVMKALGFVNRFGRGVLRAQEALAANGNPPADFRFDAGFVLATLRPPL